MSVDAVKNFALSFIEVGPSPASSGKTLTLVAGGAALMPAAPFNATCWPPGVAPLASNAEIVRVSNITGSVVTLSARAQEGTSAQSIEAGWQFADMLTAHTVESLAEAIATAQAAAEAAAAAERTAREAAVAAAQAAAEAASIPLTQKGAASGVASLTAGSIGAQPPAHHASTHAEGGSDPLTTADLPASVASGSLNLVPPWNASVVYKVGEAPSRYGIIYKAIQESTGVDPATDNGANWKAVGYSQGHGAEFNGDFRNTPYGNVGAAGGKKTEPTSTIGDYDHLLTQEPNRLIYQRYPAVRGSGSLRAEARENDDEGGKNRTEFTGTNSGKQWYAGDEVWLTIAHMFEPGYPTLSGAGEFRIFHQNFNQDSFAQGGGETTLTEEVSLPQAKIPVEPIKGRSLLAAGSVKLGTETVTYTKRSPDNRFLEGCTGGTEKHASGTLVTQPAYSAKLAKETTFPTATVEVTSTAGAAPEGICETATGVPFRYTGIAGNTFTGCTGGASEGSPVKVPSGTLVTGAISGGSPAFALEVNTAGTFVVAHVRGGNKPLNPSETSPTNTSQVLGPVVTGAWRIYRVHLVLSTEENGLVEVWEREPNGQYSVAPQASFTGPNVQSSLGHPLPFYLETGVYSGEGPATVVSRYGSIKVALSRLEADAFWSQSGAQEVSEEPLPIKKLWLPYGQPPVASAETTGGAKQLYLARMDPIPKAGLLKYLSFFVVENLGAGNVQLVLFDTGNAKAGKLTCVYASPSTAYGASKEWQRFEPNFAVTRGQDLFAGIITETANIKFARISTSAEERDQLPEGFLPAAGGALPKLALSFTGLTYPVTVGLEENDTTKSNRTTAIPFILGQVE